MGIRSAVKFTKRGEEVYEKEFNFENTCSVLFGNSLGILNGEAIRINLRKELQEYEKKLEEGDEKAKNLPLMQRFYIQLAYGLENGTFTLLPTPFSTDNAFFFQQTEGYTEGKGF